MASPSPPCWPRRLLATPLGVLPGSVVAGARQTSASDKLPCRADERIGQSRRVAEVCVGESGMLAHERIEQSAMLTSASVDTPGGA